MVDFGQLAVDTLRAQGASIQSGIEIGRGQFAREVLGWIERNRDASGWAHTEALRALCEGRK